MVFLLLSWRLRRGGRGGISSSLSHGGVAPRYGWRGLHTTSFQSSLSSLGCARGGLLHAPPPPLKLSPAELYKNGRIVGCSVHCWLYPGRAQKPPPGRANVPQRRRSSTYANHHPHQERWNHTTSYTNLEMLKEDWQLRLSSPVARNMAKQLVDFERCPLGFNPRASSSSNLEPKTNKTKNYNSSHKGAIEYCRMQKKKRPDCLVLARVGDCYEAFGVDAVLLVEHVAGDPPVDGKAMVPVPKRVLPPTLHRLTGRGFSVIVSEGTDLNNAPHEIVTPASPKHHSSLPSGNEDTFRTDYHARPYVGVLHRTTGYTVVQVHLDDQTVRVWERLTDRAVASFLAADPPTWPIWYVASSNEAKNGGVKSKLKQRPFLTAPTLLTRYGVVVGNITAGREIEVIDPQFLPNVQHEQSDAEWAKELILSRALAKERTENPNQEDRDCLRPDDFTLVQRSSNNANQGTTQPLQLGTAKQLGIFPSRAFPSLLSYVLPRSAPQQTIKWVESWLLTPPPHDVAQAMADLVEFARQTKSSFPSGIKPVSSTGRLFDFLRKGKANVRDFAEIWNQLVSTRDLVPILITAEQDDGISEALLKVLQYESGELLLYQVLDKQSCSRSGLEMLKQKCKEVAKLIESVIPNDLLQHGFPTVIIMSAPNAKLCQNPLSTNMNLPGIVK
ncbi:hypothetical protein ACA910_008399 [Epithemia clementina (nom. ined.)]